MRSNYNNNKIGLIAGAGMLLAFVVIIASFTFSWFKTSKYVTNNYLNTKTLNIVVTGYNDKYYTNNNDDSAIISSDSLFTFDNGQYEMQNSKDKYVNYEYGTSYKISESKLWYCLENTNVWYEAGSVTGASDGAPWQWDLPRPGIEPLSPALAGRFFTTGPPGNPRSNSNRSKF